jgi:SAM-dependent methyltransferase
MILIWLICGIVLVFGFVVAFGAPYVPSLRGEVRQAFKRLYELGRHDVVVDLGSGDGQVLIEAAKKGAKKLYGYELNPVLVGISRLRLRGRADIRLANMWSVRLPEDVTLVYAFVVSRDTRRLVGFLEREATRLGRPLTVMTFGADLPDKRPKAVLKAHSLYEISPLQTMVA